MRPLLVGLVVLLLLPTAASASGRQVLRDCGDDERLSKRYSQGEYRTALALLDGDAAEYTNCRDVIRRAQLAALAGAGGGGGAEGGAGAAGGGSGGGGAGGATGGGAAGAGAGAAADPSGDGTANAPLDPLAAATPADRAALDRAREADGPVPLADGGLVRPGTSREPALSAVSDLPAPVLLVLVLLAVGLAAAAAARVRTGVLARRAA